jgi:hypothetical protein
MIKHLLLTFVVTVAATVSSRADFADYYAFPQNFLRVIGSGSQTYPANNWSIVSDVTWTPSGLGSPYVSASPSQLSLDSGEIFGFPGQPGSYTILQVLSTAPSSGFWSFDFTLSLGTTTNGLSSGSYVVNGMQFGLGAGSGTVSSIFLNAGDVFGFRIAGQQFSTGTPGGRAGLTVTNFAAPVPEPSTIALAVIATAVFGALSRRAQRI